MDDPLETRYSSTYLSHQFDRSKSNRLGVGRSQNLSGMLSPAALEWKACQTPEKHAPAPEVIVPNLVALDQTIRTWVGGPKNFGDAGVPSLGTGGRGLPLESCFSSTHRSCLPISVILCQTEQASLTEIRQKN